MRYLLTRFVPAGSVILAITTFSSYGLGLLRDRIFAQTFGLSAELDAYNAAFLLPDFLFNFLVASGIAAAVVPLFAELKQQGYGKAYDYINSVISLSLLVMGLVAAALILLAGPASYLVAPGLAPEQRAAVTQLMRLLALSPLLFAVSNSLGAMLVAEKRFLFYGLSPVLYNLGIIVGVVTLAPSLGIMSAAVGTLGGALLHAAIRLVGSWREGWRWRRPESWKTTAIKRTLRLMLPKMVGHPVELLTFWIFTAFASTLSAGSISALNFARNFQSVPVSLIGITMSTTAFPLLAEAFAQKQAGAFAKTLGRILASIFLISAAAAWLLYLTREPLVTKLLGGGAFDGAAAQHTATVLGVFCLAIPTEAVNHLLARAFYARQNTLLPVTFSVAALGVAAGAAWWLLPSWGLIALPAGFVAGSWLKTGGLLAVLLANNKHHPAA
jgi:putative peptidoglycan lipid II flippase